MRVLAWVIGLCSVALIGLCIGPADMGFGASFSALFGRGDPAHVQIVQDLRLPRVLLAAVIGAGLGASGAALQAYTRNPLAAPGVLGFSACAAFGAVAALYFGLSRFVPFAALTGAALGAALILAMTGVRKSAGVLILAGVGIGSLATALTGLLMNFAPNPWALSEIVYWLMGSLRNADRNSLLMTTGLTVIGLGVLIIISSDLRNLALGEETAVSLGVSLKRLQILLVIGVALCVGSGVAVAGAIGFVGLFVPHILRMMTGHNPQTLIPYSALGGAMFLMVADMLTRLLSGFGSTLYLGILTSLIGVPFFLWLAVRETRS